MCVFVELASGYEKTGTSDRPSGLFSGLAEQLIERGLRVSDDQPFLFRTAFGAFGLRLGRRFAHYGTLIEVPRPGVGPGRLVRSPACKAGLSANSSTGAQALLSSTRRRINFRGVQRQITLSVELLESNLLHRDDSRWHQIGTWRGSNIRGSKAKLHGQSPNSPMKIELLDQQFNKLSVSENKLCSFRHGGSPVLWRCSGGDQSARNRIEDLNVPGPRKLNIVRVPTDRTFHYSYSNFEVGSLILRDCHLALAQVEEIVRSSISRPTLCKYLRQDWAILIVWIAVVVDNNRDFVTKSAWVLHDVHHRQVTWIIQDL